MDLNPIFVQLLTREPDFLDFNNAARLPGLRLILDEGRSWLSRSQESFDLIQMSLVDTWAATGAGAFTLSENGLYTVEAWKIFLSRLTPRGVLTVSRWYDASVPDETGRLISLATAALMEMGNAEPRRRLFLASQGRVATLVLSKSPLTVCVAAITPAGLLLGFGFPTGMRLIAAIDPRLTPWFWGINGAAGVLAAISAVAVSLALGISATLILGALCYFLLIPVALALVQAKILVQPKAIKFSKKQAR